MGTIMNSDILQAIWENKETKHIYVQALKITEEARFPDDYERFKSNRHGLEKQEFESALRILKDLGWQEPLHLVK